MKTYKNDSYTRTVEVIKTSEKCEELGWFQNVKVTTVFNDPNNGEKITVEDRYYCGENYLDYASCGHHYYYKRK